ASPRSRVWSLPSASASRFDASASRLSASAKRCFRSGALALSSFVGLRAGDRLASVFAFLGFPRRSIGFPLPPTAIDRRQARRKPRCEQAETVVASLPFAGDLRVSAD